MEEKKSIATEVAKENENANAVAEPTTEELKQQLAEAKQQLAEAKQEIIEEKDLCSRISGYWREAENKASLLGYMLKMVVNSEYCNVTLPQLVNKLVK